MSRRLSHLSLLLIWILALPVCFANSAVQQTQISSTEISKGRGVVSETEAQEQQRLAQEAAEAEVRRVATLNQEAADINNDGSVNEEDFEEVRLSEKQSAINFKPVVGDISVVFLGNIFGVVDGVLAGNGSQVAGQLFGIFNTAILALAGMLVFYTLLVSTMNTAQDGQNIGKRWSSVYVPFRAIAGITLLLPKVSGYCVLQIFIMWIVVQGIGAADKVWSSALSYLNRGGTIIRPNVDPITNMSQNSDTDVFNAAYGMLTGQVCMAALYKKLDAYQTSYSASDTCTTGDYEYNGAIESFCKTPVPNFINSVDFVTDEVLAVQPNGCMRSEDKASVPMPNFSTSVSPYDVFNGVCGTVKFCNFEAPDNMGLTHQERQTVSASRAIAVNQMYVYLTPLAEKLVENAPVFNPSIDCKKTGCVNPVIAENSWGVPLTLSLDYCRAMLDPTAPKGYSSKACLSWELPGGAIDKPVLLRGTELQDAVATYNGMMSASLYLNSQSSESNNYKEERAFISKARQTGWLLAGAYYFRLAILTSQVLQKTGSHTNDDQSGLEVCSSTGSAVEACGAGRWSTEALRKFFVSIKDTQQQAGDGCRILSTAGTEYVELFCSLDGDNSVIEDMTYSTIELISGEPKDAQAQTVIPKFESTRLQAPVYGIAAADAPFNNPRFTHPNSVYGYLINGTALVLPGQPGKKQPQFVLSMDYNAASETPKLGESKIKGGKWGVPGQVISLIFSFVVKYFFNFLVELIVPMINMVIFAFLQPPVILLASMFLGAMEVLKDPNVNPILALANMGVGFIEGSANSFLVMTGVGIGAAVLGSAALSLMMALLPVVMMWLGIMTGVGVTATYYLPLIPFTVFLFASIGWLVGVVEAMVAAPLMAIGVMQPDGEHPFGRSDQAYMLLLGIFLRPSMMVIGYIFGIILSYVGIWLVNAGFSIITTEIRNLPRIDTASKGITKSISKFGSQVFGNNTIYGMWSTIFLFFFMLLTYISTIIAVVNKAFELIYHVPDKVMRWIQGGQESDLGSSATKTMMQDVKKAHQEGEKNTSQTVAKFASSAMAEAMKYGVAMVDGAKDLVKAAASAATGGDPGKMASFKKDAQIGGLKTLKKLQGKDKDFNALIEDIQNLTNNSSKTKSFGKGHSEDDEDDDDDDDSDDEDNNDEDSATGKQAAAAKNQTLDAMVGGAAKQAKKGGKKGRSKKRRGGRGGKALKILRAPKSLAKGVFGGIKFGMKATNFAAGLVTGSSQRQMRRALSKRMSKAGRSAMRDIKAKAAKNDGTKLGRLAKGVAWLDRGANKIAGYGRVAGASIGRIGLEAFDAKRKLGMAAAKLAKTGLDSAGDAASNIAANRRYRKTGKWSKGRNKGPGDRKVTRQQRRQLSHKDQRKKQREKEAEAQKRQRKGKAEDSEDEFLAASIGGSSDADNIDDKEDLADSEQATETDATPKGQDDDNNDGASFNNDLVGAETDKQGSLNEWRKNETTKLEENLDKADELLDKLEAKAKKGELSAKEKKARTMLKAGKARLEQTQKDLRDSEDKLDDVNDKLDDVNEKILDQDEKIANALNALDDKRLSRSERDEARKQLSEAKKAKSTLDKERKNLVREKIVARKRVNLAKENIYNKKYQKSRLLEKAIYGDESDTEWDAEEMANIMDENHDHSKDAFNGISGNLYSLAGNYDINGDECSQSGLDAEYSFDGNSYADAKGQSERFALGKEVTGVKRATVTKQDRKIAAKQKRLSAKDRKLQKLIRETGGGIGTKLILLLGSKLVTGAASAASYAKDVGDKYENLVFDVLGDGDDKKLKKLEAMEKLATATVKDAKKKKDKAKEARDKAKAKLNDSKKGSSKEQKAAQKALDKAERQLAKASLKLDNAKVEQDLVINQGVLDKAGEKAKKELEKVEKKYNKDLDKAKINAGKLKEKIGASKAEVAEKQKALDEATETFAKEAARFDAEDHEGLEKSEIDASTSAYYEAKEKLNKAKRDFKKANAAFTKAEMAHAKAKGKVQKIQVGFIQKLKGDGKNDPGLLSKLTREKVHRVLKHDIAEQKALRSQEGKTTKFIQARDEKYGGSTWMAMRKESGAYLKNTANSVTTTWKNRGKIASDAKAKAAKTYQSFVLGAGRLKGKGFAAASAKYNVVFGTKAESEALKAQDRIAKFEKENNVLEGESFDEIIEKRVKAADGNIERNITEMDSIDSEVGNIDTDIAKLNEDIEKAEAAQKADEAADLFSEMPFAPEEDSDTSTEDASTSAPKVDLYAQRQLLLRRKIQMEQRKQRLERSNQSLVAIKALELQAKEGMKELRSGLADAKGAIRQERLKKYDTQQYQETKALASELKSQIEATLQDDPYADVSEQRAALAEATAQIEKVEYAINREDYSNNLYQSVKGHIAGGINKEKEAISQEYRRVMRKAYNISKSSRIPGVGKVKAGIYLGGVATKKVVTNTVKLGYQAGKYSIKFAFVGVLFGIFAPGMAMQMMSNQVGRKMNSMLDDALAKEGIVLDKNGRLNYVTPKVRENVPLPEPKSVTRENTTLTVNGLVTPEASKRLTQGITRKGPPIGNDFSDFTDGDNDGAEQSLIIAEENAMLRPTMMQNSGEVVKVAQERQLKPKPSVSPPPSIPEADISALANATSKSQLRKIYHKLALKYHPDKNKDKKIDRSVFQSIQSQYEALMEKYEKPDDSEDVD